MLGVIFKIPVTGKWISFALFQNDTFEKEKKSRTPTLLFKAKLEKHWAVKIFSVWDEESVGGKYS